MEGLATFVQSIENFYDKRQSEQIAYFGYFLIENCSYEHFIPKDINDCFSLLHIPPYSNISSYLNRNCKRAKNKKQKFIKNKKGFTLTANTRQEIQKVLQIPIEHKPTEELITLEIFNKTRGYLVNNAKEASLCYDFGQYNACLIMLRKLIETLIIELFEKKCLENTIKDSNNDYFQLSYLLISTLNDQKYSNYLSNIS